MDVHEGMEITFIFCNAGAACNKFLSLHKASVSPCCHCSLAFNQPLAGDAELLISTAKHKLGAEYSPVRPALNPREVPLYCKRQKPTLETPFSVARN